MPTFSLSCAAESFSVGAQVGDPTSGRTGARVTEVHSDLKNTLVLIDSGDDQLAIVTSPLGIESREMHAAICTALAETLALRADQVFGAASHDHCVPNCVDDAVFDWQKPQGLARPGSLNPLGQAFLAGLRTAALHVRSRLRPVTLEWGKANETRITFNRRGRRSDGRPYFIREEDRLLLEPSYTGEIDPEAIVAIFRAADRQPVAALAFFTGHPVTAYNPERMIVWGEWPQVACEQLSARLDGAPVAFLQGCAGNINSKYMLGGTVAQSRELGGFLGDAFASAVAHAQPSLRPGLRRHVTTVQLPLAPLPDVAALEQDLAEIDAFIRRGQANDPAALECVGMNFPRALTPPYRAKLVEMIRPWFVLSLQAHREGRAHLAPRALPVEITVARIGDIGLVGLPFEPFVRIGLKIKRESPLPCTLPCGYTNASHGYIPDATACDDREYMGGFFRYTAGRPPFAAPGGEVAADAAVAILKQLSQ